MDGFVQECIENHPPSALKGLMLKFRQVVSHLHVLVPLVEPDQIRSRRKKVDFCTKKKPRGTRKQTRDPIAAEIVENEVQMAAKKKAKVDSISKKRKAKRCVRRLSPSESASPTDSESNQSTEEEPLELEEGNKDDSDDSKSSESSLEDLEELMQCVTSPGINEDLQEVSPNHMLIKILTQMDLIEGCLE